MQPNRLLRLPRMPFAPKLDKTTRQPSTPTLESLNQPMIPAKKYPYFYPKKDLAPHIRLSQPKKEKRYLTQVETARPLPDTFPATKSFKDYKQKPLMCEPLPEGEYHYPYRYYEICLRRGLIGLPKKTREIVNALGLHTRHQVVWRLVSPRSAGQILRVKELVHVRLVNEIPEKPKYPKGFTKVASFVENKSL